MYQENLLAFALGAMLGMMRSRRVTLPPVPHVRYSWLLLIGVTLLAASSFLVPVHAFIPALGFAVAHAFLFAGFALNLNLSGVWLLASGMAANLTVIVANGCEMPVRVLATAHGPALLADPRHELLTSATRLPLLADIIAVPRYLWIPAGVVSAGDVLIAAGAFWFANWWVGRPMGQAPADGGRGDHVPGTMT